MKATASRRGRNAEPADRIEIALGIQPNGVAGPHQGSTTRRELPLGYTVQNLGTVELTSGATISFAALTTVSTCGDDPSLPMDWANQPSIGRIDESTIALRTVALRRSHNISKSAFAKILGVSRPTVYDLERGARRLYADEVFRVAMALDLSLEYFFGGAREYRSAGVLSRPTA